jgi:hypothetical protein
MNYPIPDVNVYNSQEEICGLKSDDHVMEPPANAGGLSITWPYDSASIQAGSSVVVRVSCDKKPYAGVYLASYDCDLKVDYSEPYEFEFTVNDTSIGPMPIVTWTMNEDGSVSYDLVELHIVTTELLEEITTLPSGPLYLQSGEEVILCVDGVYQGGTIRDLTSLTSTHYTSSDPRVVEISSKGVIKARFPGRAVVTIENAGVSANIDIVVKMVKGIQIAGVAINTEWDYEDPDDSNDTEYTFSFEVITDESVENMVIFTLGVDLFEIPKIPEQEIDTPGGYIETGREYDADISAYRWYYEAIFDNPNGLDDYGDGNYTIIVQYNNGHIEQKNVWFGIPDTNEPIPQPTKEPVFTSFANGATLASPVTFTWESCIDPNAKIINVNLDNEDTDEEMNYILNGNTTGFEEPVPLSDGQWEAELSYIVYYQTETIDGIQVFCCKSSQSDYKFAVP